MAVLMGFNEHIQVERLYTCLPFVYMLALLVLCIFSPEIMH